MLQWISLVGFPRLGHINSSASIPHILCFSFLPSFCLSLLQVVMTLSSVHVGWLTQKESPVPAVTVRFYAREVSQEFAYVQIDSHLFEISQRYIWCLRQPYQFLTSALQARHVRAHFECPGTLRPLHSQLKSKPLPLGGQPVEQYSSQPIDTTYSNSNRLPQTFPT